MPIVISSKDAERLTKDDRWAAIPFNPIDNTVVGFNDYNVTITLDDCNDRVEIRLVYHEDIKNILNNLTDEQLTKLGFVRTNKRT